MSVQWNHVSALIAMQRRFPFLSYLWRKFQLLPYFLLAVFGASRSITDSEILTLISLKEKINKISTHFSNVMKSYVVKIMCSFCLIKLLFFHFISLQVDHIVIGTGW